MRTAVTEMFGIEVPIFAFSHCRDVVAAVTKAGGMGVLGAVAHSPEQLEIDLDWIEAEVGDRPYGVDLIVPAESTGPTRRAACRSPRPRSDPRRAPGVRRRHPRAATTCPSCPTDDDGEPRPGGQSATPAGMIFSAERPTRSSRSRSPTASRSSSTPSARRRAHDRAGQAGRAGDRGARRRRPARRAPRQAGRRPHRRPGLRGRRPHRRDRTMVLIPEVVDAVATSRCSAPAGSAAAGRWPRPWRSARRACGAARCG